MLSKIKILSYSGLIIASFLTWNLCFSSALTIDENGDAEFNGNVTFNKNVIFNGSVTFNGSVKIGSKSKPVSLTLNDNEIGSFPPGAIIMWGSDTIPSGWLLCDGSLYKQDAYQKLFDAINLAFGTGGNRPYDEFYVPDLRGRFVRGASGTSERDPDMNSRSNMQSPVNYSGIGSIQNDEFKSHVHQFYGLGGSGNMASGTYWANVALPTGSAGGNETRPINAYLNFIIKY